MDGFFCFIATVLMLRFSNACDASQAIGCADQSLGIYPDILDAIVKN
jgi:hypothetical protein